MRVAEEGEDRGEIEKVALLAGVFAADGIDTVNAPGVSICRRL